MKKASQQRDFFFTPLCTVWTFPIFFPQRNIIMIGEGWGEREKVNSPHSATPNPRNDDERYVSPVVIVGRKRSKHPIITCLITWDSGWFNEIRNASCVLRVCLSDWKLSNEYSSEFGPTTVNHRPIEFSLIMFQLTNCPICLPVDLAKTVENF